MTWLKIDDGFTEHEKIEGLSDRAFRLHLASLCLCARLLTDGRISETNLRKTAAGIRMSNFQRYISELVEARLWSAHSKGGWKIKDFLQYNPSSVQVKERRDKDAARQAEWRRSHGVTNNGRPSAPSRTPLNTKNNNHVGPSDVELIDEAAISNIETMRQRIGRSMT